MADSISQFLLGYTILAFTVVEYILSSVSGELSESEVVVKRRVCDVRR